MGGVVILAIIFFVIGAICVISELSEVNGNYDNPYELSAASGTLLIIIGVLILIQGAIS